MTEDRLHDELRKARDMYRTLMGEVKARIVNLNLLLSNTTGLPVPIAEECAYLQLRLLCECIALGCVVVHGGVGEAQSNKYQREDSADALMKALTELNPMFYPQRLRPNPRMPGLPPVFEPTIPPVFPKRRIGQTLCDYTSVLPSRQRKNHEI